MGEVDTMRWPCEVKADRQERRNVALREVPVTLAEWRANWDDRWPEALRRNPVEPRLTCPWQLLEAIELWAVETKRFYRSGFGPNGHENGFNVFFRRLEGSWPAVASGWTTDEINGALDDV